MEAPEVPLESAQEDISHHAQHAPPDVRQWIMGVALTSAIFAACAAVASLLAGHHVNEALICQIQSSGETIKASDQWAYYQAKGIKAGILSAKIDLLKSMDKPPGPKDEANATRYEEEQKEIKEKAEEHEKEAKKLVEEGEQHLAWHVILARAVTMFQVSIAIAAVAVLVKKKPLWWVSILFGLAGVFFLAQQLLGQSAVH